jgi:hypothetical protein
VGEAALMERHATAALGLLALRADNSSVAVDGGWMT